MQKDIILVTIDCWRDDSLQQMTGISEEINNSLARSKIKSTSNATLWAFPGILKGRFFPEVYNRSENAATDGGHLATTLENNGYETAAFVAANPNVNSYLDEFDYSENGEYYPNPDINPFAEWRARASNFARFSKEVPASKLLKEARKWFESRSSPAFLWVHLMEPHEPYFPGLRRGIDVGLLRSYYAVIKQWRANGTLTNRELITLKRLYDETIKNIDTSLIDELEWMTDDDTILVLTGDHGERFENGTAGHFGFTDSVLSVPFISNRSKIVEDTNDIRHIPKSILSEAGISPPKILVPDLLNNEDGVPVIGGGGFPPNREMTVGVATEEKVETVDIRKSCKSREDTSDELDIVVETTQESGLLQAQNSQISEPASARLKDLGYI